MLRNDFGKQLKIIMNQRGLSFSELSKMSGINRDHLYHLVDGTKEIGIDTIEKICNCLEINVSDFFNFKYMIEYDETEINILKDIDNLPKDYWDFKGIKTDVLVHTIHPYPAVMIYPISRSILDIVMKYRKIDVLMDPFAGSGTVLVEGQLHSIKEIIGNDLNPLANLIAKAKTKILSKKDFEDIDKLQKEIVDLNRKYINQIFELMNFVIANYSITEKGEWTANCKDIILNYFKNSDITNNFEIPNIPNLGFWFRPETIPAIFIIKRKIDLINNSNIVDFLYCTLSETIRYVSNTRNGEFKLYRMTEKSIMDKQYNVFDIFDNILNKNIAKMKEYISNLPNANSKIINLAEDSRKLDSVKDESVDIVITSPPYGDSHTTVAYGQFSRLSNDLLGLADGVTIDNILLGGKKKKERNINKLGSETLIKIYNQIKEIDENRANEVLDFYIDLDETLKNISKKTKTFGFNFWVVGNRTVKKVYIPTDQILLEMYKKYNMQCLKRFYRNISNKVMPSKNSPSNIAGDNITTMCSEIILFFKKNYK
jgi:site-specific DNA-methyltransferase (cytosine-N4-specific)